MQSSYVSGIAQGANVGKDQVIILGVTMGSSVTVNTQVFGTFWIDIKAHRSAILRQLSLICQCEVLQHDLYRNPCITPDTPLTSW